MERYKYYQFEDTARRATDYTEKQVPALRIVAMGCPGVPVMKLPLIAATIVVYTVLALAWIVYAGLNPQNPLF